MAEPVAAPGADRDRAALRRLSDGYAAAVDALDGGAFADLFTEDGELWVPDVTRGGDPVVRRAGREALARIPAGLARYHATCHGVGRADFAVDGETATGDVTGVAHHLSAGPSGGDGPGTDTIWHLRYVDTYRRTGDGWRIARRALHLRGTEERPLPRTGPGR